jgi:hypothetical protein
MTLKKPSFRSRYLDNGINYNIILKYSSRGEGIMSFTLICDECGSKNVSVTGTTDYNVIIKCEDCGQTKEAD